MSKIKLFTSLMAFAVTHDLDLPELDELSGMLAQKAHRNPSPTEISTLGFIPPVGERGSFVEKVSPGVFYIALKHTERVLPGYVVREAVLERIRKIEEEQMRRVYAKERNQIKDDVVIDLLPRAFPKHRRIDILVTPHVIFVDSTSRKRAEMALSRLRDVLGSLGVTPFGTNSRPIDTMTHWVLHQERPSEYLLQGESFKSQGVSDETESLSGSGIRLSDDEDLLAALHNRVVTELALTWIDNSNNLYKCSTSFSINDELLLKSIRWPEEMGHMLAAQIGEDESEVTLNRATIRLVSDSIWRLWREVVQAFGGQLQPQGLSDQADDEDDAEDLV